MALPGPMDRSLGISVSLAYAELFNAGKMASNDPEEWPQARIVEVLDNRICPLCAYLNGMVLDVTSPEYALYSLPSHINCRRVLSYIHRDAKREVTFKEPAPELLAKYGHYHINPDKYASYRVPAEPAGRQFIVRKVTNPETGETVVKLDWAPWWDQIPQWKREVVEEARTTTDPAKLAELLGKLGISDPAAPEAQRELILLGLKDRIQGWITAAAGAVRKAVKKLLE